MVAGCNRVGTELQYWNTTALLGKTVSRSDPEQLSLDDDDDDDDDAPAAHVYRLLTVWVTITSLMI